jgi:hypothetical protein
MWGPRSASSPPFPLPLYLFPTVTQGLASRKRPACPAPSSPATPPDVAAWPGERTPRDPNRLLLCPETLAPPYKYRFPASSPKIRRRPLVISPYPPQEERRRGGEGEAGGEGIGGRPWENPRSPRRWTPTSPTGLQARPPEEGMPCVDRK